MQRDKQNSTLLFYIYRQWLLAHKTPDKVNDVVHQTTNQGEFFHPTQDDEKKGDKQRAQNRHPEDDTQTPHHSQHEVLPHKLPRILHHLEEFLGIGSQGFPQLLNNLFHLVRQQKLYLFFLFLFWLALSFAHRFQYH